MSLTKLLLILAALSLSGCATVNIANDRPIIDREFKKLASWVEINTNYDPYSNQIHVDNSELQSRFKDMRRNINYRASVEYKHLSNDVKETCSNLSAPHWMCKKLRKAIFNSNIQDKWKRQAWKKFLYKSLVITQKGYPEGNVNFGSYTVPVQFSVTLEGFTPGSMHIPTLTHNFSIKKNVQIPKQEKNTSTANNGASMLDKLTQLKELKDEGLISEGEFKKLKTRLLKDI